MNRTLAAIALTLTLVTTAASAATLIRYFDANDPASWNGSVLKDISGNLGTSLIPDDGTPQTGTPRGIPVTPADYAAPVYVASGAALPEAATPGKSMDRAYLDFQKFGILAGGDFTPNNLGSVTGYTYEGIFYLGTGATPYQAVENTAMGTTHGGNDNTFLYMAGGTSTSLVSRTFVDDAAGGPQALRGAAIDITSIIPVGQWFHFVKVHDAANNQILHYVNGVLQPSMTLSLTTTPAVEYHQFGEVWGNAGSDYRELRNVGYSMTRFYSGALTADEVYANFLASTTIPEPASVFALGLGCALAFRRRRN